MDILDAFLKMDELLAKNESTSEADLKKAEALLKKIPASAKKSNAGLLVLQGKLHFLNKKYSQAIESLSGSIDADPRLGHNYLWRACAHVANGDADAALKDLAACYKQDKSVALKAKTMKGFGDLLKDPRFEEALGKKSKAQIQREVESGIDPVAQKFVEYVLENQDLSDEGLLKLTLKFQSKAKDWTSFWDAQIFALQPLIDDASEHELSDDEEYDESSFSLKDLKSMLKEARAERKKLGRGVSHFSRSVS